MEELFLFGAICLILGSSVIAWYYPVTTALCIGVVLSSSFVWMNKKRRQLAWQEKEQNRLNRVKNYPELSRIYIPDFEQKITEELKDLKTILKKKQLTEVADLLSSIEEFVDTKILPKKEQLLETLDRYIHTNHLVLKEQISFEEKKLSECSDPSMKKLIESTLINLKQKQEVLEKSRQEIVYFYSVLANILLQVDNMKLKSSQFHESQELLLEDLKLDLNHTFDDFSGANALLDEISKL
jgi:hypothetical protein